MDRVKTRKPHKKSRNGCLPCKARHVKCDEQRPYCANCVKQDTSCEYRPSRSAEASLNGSPLSSALPVQTPSSNGTAFENNPTFDTTPIAAAPEITLNIPQLRLLHHYTTTTARTLAFNADAEDIFTKNLVMTAFEYPYLLYMVLALAAVHIDYLEGHARNGNLDYRIQAERYHDAAITSFRETVRDIDATNFEPILMFAGILFPHLCAASISAQTDQDQNFDSILSNMILTRRVRPMVGRFYSLLKASELARVIPPDVQNIDFVGKEPPEETELVQLRKFSEVVHHVYPPDIVDAYAQAIHLLETVFDRAAQSPLPPSDALLKIWMHLVTDRYMELLSERQPGSLIIFAHFAVLIRRSVHYWYFEGFAEQVLAIVDTLVPTEWKAWLDWPKEQIWGENSVPTPG